MENEDFKNIWNAFNKNIDSVEKTKKQVLKQMISGKSEMKLQIMKFQSILGILLPPVVLILLIVPMVKSVAITPYFVTGVVLLIFVLIYSFVQALNYYKLLNLVKPAYEPVIKTQKRILTLKKFMAQLQTRRNISFPVIAAAFILILWDRINFNQPANIAIIAVTIIGVYFWGKLKYRLYFKDRINSIDLELKELEEYI